MQKRSDKEICSGTKCSKMIMMMMIILAEPSEFSEKMKFLDGNSLRKRFVFWNFGFLFVKIR